MRKFVALALAGAMILSMPVMAETSPSAEDVASTQTQAAPAVSDDSGVPAAIVAAAAAEGKTVGEYMNNAVTSLPGLTDVLPLGQGGHVIINGAPSNHVFAVAKPTTASVNSAKAFASSLGGKVLNVAQIKASVAGFNTATVNFYLKGTKAGQNIKVYQLVNGQWVAITVTEIRLDHVVVDMTSLGTLAFIEVPIQ